MEYTGYLILVLFTWNGAVFFLFAMDKYRARRDQWRVSEQVLLLCSFLCGGLGGLLGMQLLRHKTRHLKFRILLPIAFLLTLAAVVYLQHRLQAVSSFWTLF